MRDRLKNVLEEITAARVLEAEFLHTLALLEFTGARKISRTVGEHFPTLDVLEHMADETRHAAALKKLAVQIFGGEPGYLAHKAAKTYFYKLDRELAAWVEGLVGEPDMKLTYQLVTTMIERRAMILYPLYRRATATGSVRDELRAIIVEEQGHRVAIEEACLATLQTFGVTSLATPEAVEQAFFAQFLDALCAEVEGRTNFAKSA